MIKKDMEYKYLKNGKIVRFGAATNKIKEGAKALDLLKRWARVDVPYTVWSEPGEDYELPLDTQLFLRDLE